VQATKYSAVFATSVRNQVAYWGEWLLRGVFLMMVLFVFLQLWRATYGAQAQADHPSGGRVIGGFTLPQMLWYLALTESIVLSRPRVNQTIDQEVRSGDIAYVLLRPYAYAGYHLATYLGERVLRFATTLAIASVLAALYVGPVQVTAAHSAAALLALGLAMLIDFLGSFAVGLLAFWTEDTDSIGLIYDRAVMLLGGMFLPLSLLPAAIARVADALPFSVLVYGPARLALGDPEANLAAIVVRQALALVLFGAVAAGLYRAALRRVSVNGG
jgi:ABC-2 type transport system permease protein